MTRAELIWLAKAEMRRRTATGECAEVAGVRSHPFFDTDTARDTVAISFRFADDSTFLLHAVGNARALLAAAEETVMKR